MQKFQYIVACQVYGRMKKNQDPKADDIEMLLHRFPNLRVAYIDEVCDSIIPHVCLFVDRSMISTPSPMYAGLCRSM